MPEGGGRAGVRGGRPVGCAEGHGRRGRPRARAGRPAGGGAAYLDGAWIAQEQKDARQVWELGHRAEMLADSPLLGPADRAAILGRIERAPEAVRLAMRQEP